MNETKAFEWRRRQNWIIIGVLYALFMMSRYNYSAISPLLLAAFGWNKEDLSFLETALPFFYGLSVIVNATIVDRIGGRKAYLIGSAGVVAANILFGCGRWLIGSYTPHQTALIMSCVVALNAYFQSFGAMAIIQINAQWFRHDERGTFSAIFGILIRMGLVFAFSGVPFIAAKTAWYWGFWIPAALVAVVACLDYFFVTDKPEEAGYPAVVPDDHEAAKYKPTTLQLIKGVLSNRNILVFAVTSIMIGFVRRSVVDAWWPLYMKEVLGVTGTSLIAQATPWGIAICGILGGFAIGPISDRLGRRAPVISAGFLGMALSLCVFRFVTPKSLGGWETVACLALLSFFVNGVHGVIMGAASMDIGGKHGSSSAAGIFDGAQYFFAAPFTGRICGMIIQRFGWTVWKVWPIPFALAGAGLMLLVWSVPSKKHAGGH
ncbi:MAG: MFS transporter [Elusimicrobia bacterium]|nr:MFS transporter [Elusimicrobiota bacterium]